jgi:hypothetical protein
MKYERNCNENAVVGQSREISEDRWLAIKGELDEARVVSLAGVEPHEGLSKLKDRIGSYSGGNTSD